ncbi:MAG: hypothetical protein KatS3mg085_606 [Candidatus Dojkabacteria bacterium]|nr:MAG: hypothetical protein KatS3mg085_606 [Candidatus Dojkabacteria bacterium]
MKTVYVRDIKKNMFIDSEAFVVLDYSESKDKNGNTYYNITFGDKTGKIPAKLWSQQFETANPKLLKTGKILSVTAKVDDFRGSLQLNVQELKLLDETSLDEFIESSEYDPDEMIKKLFSYVKSIQNESLRKVITNILSDEEIGRKFKYWPAGNSIHHAFRSGLLQHVLEMLEIAESLKNFYTRLNFDVLTAGIILHDIGKIEELSGGLVSNYTLKGGLLGHIVLGVKIFDRFADELDENTKNHIEHLILSHHGRLEYGSPILPATPEAIALHYIDNLSSKLRSAFNAVDEISDEEELGRPNYFLEGARFWKGHNSNSDESNDSDDDQISLV